MTAVPAAVGVKVNEVAPATSSQMAVPFVAFTVQRLPLMVPSVNETSTVVPVGGAAPLLPRTRTVTKLVGAASVEPTAGRVSTGGSAVTVIDQVPVPTPPPGGTPGPPPVSGEVGSSEEQPAAASNRPAAAAWRRLFSARFSFMAGLPL